MVKDVPETHFLTYTIPQSEVCPHTLKHIDQTRIVGVPIACCRMKKLGRSVSYLQVTSYYDGHVALSNENAQIFGGQSLAESL